MTGTTTIVNAPNVTGVSPNAGTYQGSGTNQIVTISGSGFTGATTVLFGSVGTTNFTVISDAQIITAIPSVPYLGAVDVQVEAPSGLSAENPGDQFIFFPTATTAYVVELYPNTGSYLGTATTQVVRIVGYGFTGATKVLFGSVAAFDFTVLSDTLIITAIPGIPIQNVGTVDVQVEVPSGLTFKNPGDQFTYYANTGPQDQ